MGIKKHLFIVGEKKMSLLAKAEKFEKLAHPCPPGLEHYTLDEVAETLPVSKQLYSVLWGLMPAEKEENIYKGETPPEPDHSSRKWRSLKNFWHKLTPEQQQEIIAAKARDEAEMDKYRSKYAKIEKFEELIGKIANSSPHIIQSIIDHELHLAVQVMNEIKAGVRNNKLNIAVNKTNEARDILTHIMVILQGYIQQ
jgi:hypothetical protein